MENVAPNVSLATMALLLSILTIAPFWIVALVAIYAKDLRIYILMALDNHMDCVVKTAAKPYVDVLPVLCGGNTSLMVNVALNARHAVVLVMPL
jgi:hypothetical protein